MTVKIVTDSCSDISPDEAKKLDISLVPAYVHFGDKTYLDGVDLSIDEFYQKLTNTSVFPSTAAPPPGDFARVYEDLYKETDQILSIHITKRHSSLIDAAMLGRELAKKKGYDIEILDSCGVTIWQGLVAIAAARAALAGCSFQQVINTALETIGNLKGLGLLSTLKYAIRGGRLARTLFKVESLLSVKAMVNIRNGEVKPVALVRNWAKGISRLHEFLDSAKNAQVSDIAVAYNTPVEESRNLVDHIGKLFPTIAPTIARMGPTLGVHTGPGTLAVALVSRKI